MCSGGGWSVLVWEYLCAVLWAHLSSPVLHVLLASGYQHISLFEGVVPAVQLAFCAEVL